MIFKVPLLLNTLYSLIPSLFTGDFRLYKLHKVELSVKIVLKTERLRLDRRLKYVR